MKDKCKDCVHYYRVMTGPGGHGYNPNPACQLHRDKGEWPSPLTHSCFERRKK